MNEKLTKSLFEKYPDIFIDKDAPPTQSLMCFGFEFDDGWYAITDKMLAKIDLICKTTGIKVVASQFKEKYGTGRFSYNGALGIAKKGAVVENWFSIIGDIIEAWEHDTSHTCEISGEHGSLCYRGGWLKTLSAEKAKELGYKTRDE